MRPAWMIRIGLFLYDHLARREVLPGSRDGRPARAIRPASRSSAASRKRLRLFRRLGRRCAAGACSTRSTRAERGADGADAQRAASMRSAAPTGWRAAPADARPASSARSQRARAGQRGRPVGRAVPAREHGAARPRRQVRCAWSRAATSSCRACSTTTTPTSSRTPTSGSSSPSRTRATFTLIGTTDVEHHGAIGAARIDAAETAYLCEQASRYFERPVTPADVVWTYSGVRPLLDDDAGDAVGRDARLPARARHRAGRRCCRSGAARSRPSASWPRKPPTCSAALARASRGRLDRAARSLPGGDLQPWIGARAAARHRLRALRAGAARCAIPDWPAPLAQRLARAYGARIEPCCSERGGLGARSRARPARGRAALPAATTSGRAAPTTCCGGAASSACT